MQIPKQCPVCEFRKFKETLKKIICEYCGWWAWKNHNRQKTNKFSPANSGDKDPPQKAPKNQKSFRPPSENNSNSFNGANYFINPKPKEPKELIEEYEKKEDGKREKEPPFD